MKEGRRMIGETKTTAEMKDIMRSSEIVKKRNMISIKKGNMNLDLLTLKIILSTMAFKTKKTTKGDNKKDHSVAKIEINFAKKEIMESTNNQNKNTVEITEMRKRMKNLC